jgi:hypothetical protein
MAKSSEKAKNITYCSLKPNAKDGKFADMTGSHYDDFSQVVISQALYTRWTAHSDEESKNLQAQAVFGAMLGMKPQDETEAMLIAQMIGCHNAAMECFRRAMISEQPFAGRQQNLSFANKLSRTFALHMEALDKHRGKGQQTVRVEHVTVNAGGQAIVGNVQGGGGVSQKSEDQPHAESITHAPEPEMRSSFEADREALPQRGDEER